MDWKTFVVDMTSALVWPLVVVAILIAFRHILGNIAERLLSFRFRDFEFAFGNQAGKIAENIEPSNRMDQLPSAADDKLTSLAERSPRAAIIEAWLQVETSLKKLAVAHGMENENAPFSKLIHFLTQKKVLDEKTAQSLHGLITLRNLAVHAPEPELTTQKAIDFIVLASAVLFVLTTKK
jgi:hypothetical protein